MYTVHDVWKNFTVFIKKVVKTQTDWENKNKNVVSTRK